MIKQIIELLGTDEFINGNKEVQIAKGINKVPTNFKEIITQVKRSKAIKR